MSFRVKMPRGLGGHSRPVQRIVPRKTETELDKLLSLPDITDLDSIIGGQLISFDENIERWANTEIQTNGTNVTNPTSLLSGTGFIKLSSFTDINPPALFAESESDFIQVNNVVRLNYGIYFSKVTLDDKHKFTLKLSLPELPRASTSSILSGTGYGVFDQSDGNSYLLLCKSNIQENGEFQLIFVGSEKYSEGEMWVHGSWSYVV